MGALNNLIPFSLIFWGQTRITGGLAAILNATTPLFTVVLAHFMTTDERMTPNRLGGVLLGVAGVVVLIGPAVLHELGLQLLAQIAVLGAALSYALAGIFGRRFRDVPPLVSAAGQVSATTIMMLPVVLCLGAPWSVPLPGPWTWAAILGLALLSTALAYLIYFRLLASAGATNLLLVTFLIPVSAIVLGASLLGERLEPRHFGGMALIGLGLAAIDGRPLRLLRRRACRSGPNPPALATGRRSRSASHAWISWRRIARPTHRAFCPCDKPDLRPSSGGRAWAEMEARAHACVGPRRACPRTGGRAGTGERCSMRVLLIFCHPLEHS